MKLKKKGKNCLWYWEYESQHQVDLIFFAKTFKGKFERKNLLRTVFFASRKNNCRRVYLVWLVLAIAFHWQPFSTLSIFWRCFSPIFHGTKTLYSRFWWAFRFRSFFFWLWTCRITQALVSHLVSVFYASLNSFVCIILVHYAQNFWQEKLISSLLKCEIWFWHHKIASRGRFSDVSRTQKTTWQIMLQMLGKAALRKYVCCVQCLPTDWIVLGIFSRVLCILCEAVLEFGELTNTLIPLQC